MSEMVINEPVKERDVIDYDFTFTSGMRLPLTVDVEAGDTIQEFSDRFELTLVGKPSMTDLDEVLQPEDVIVYKATLAAFIKRYRKQRIPNADELFDMKKTIHQLAKSVQ